RKHVEDAGGYPYIGELWDAAPTAANVAYYARIVRDKSIRRHLIYAGQEMIQDGYDQVGPAEDMVEAAEGRLVEILQEHRSGNATWLSELVGRACDNLDERYLNGQGGIVGLRTGLNELDELLGGLRSGQLIVLGALTSVGKTQLVLVIALQIAM